MLIVLVLIVAAAVLLLCAGLFSSAERRSRPVPGRLLWYGIAFLILVVLLRFNAVGALLAAAVALVLRALPLLLPLAPLLLRWLQGETTRAGPSNLATAWLRVTFDPRSGLLDGEVLAGEWAGRRLSELPLAALRRLYAQFSEVDMPSARLLAAYLDRRFQAEWRGAETDQETTAPLSGRMSREQALAVLGLAVGASTSEIVQAHRRLMQKLHPDRGGSDLLAAMINRAKDVLLQNG